MRLVVRKSAQGPALAKGTVHVTDSMKCGIVDAMGSKAGCEITIDRDSSIAIGGDPRNGGSGAIVYRNSNCC